MKKIVLALSAAALAVSLAACGGKANSAPQPTAAPVITATPAPTATPEPTPTQAPADETSSAAPTFDVFADSENWLLRVPVSVYPLSSGNGSGIVAYRGAVQFDKDLMAERVTADDFAEFMDARFYDGCGLNWLTVDFGDGSGLYISNRLYNSYGLLDENGTVQSADGYLEITESGWVYNAK